jgi:hypothetical protein
MNQELNDELVAKYPKIFATIKHTECGDGWYTILNALCSNIQIHVDWSKCEQVVAEQVKEKFGGLRFYYSGGDEYISGLMSMTESVASVTCEVCGNPGKLRTGGWLKTLCQEHHNERAQARAQARAERNGTS